MELQIIQSKIHLIRGSKVILDRDLAALYGVETRVLKQAVRRNLKRFTNDFMFQLSKEEFINWRSQFVMSNADKMGLRIPPFAFTEQGVSMLSSVLNSDKALDVNISIMRAFVLLRQHLSDYDDLKKQVMQRGQYNQVANYVYTQSEANIKIGKKAPIDYFADIKNQCNGGELKYGGITNMSDLLKNMQENCVPSSIFDMTFDNYQDFIAERRVLIAKKIREYYETIKQSRT